MSKEIISINKPIRLIELFAGIGSQAMALRDLGANFEHYRVVEFDKFAIKSYNAIHSTDFSVSDIRDIHGDDLGIEDVDLYEYIMFYSFPCTDLSPAGRQAGMTKGSNTRSGLLWEVERLLNETENLPQILIMENVPQVHGKKNIDDFNQWIAFLESKGYSNYWKDLNAKDYGIAQNRNRCFMVSLLGDYEYIFPESIPLAKKLEDYLEDNVDESYYINTDRAAKLIQQCIDNGTLQVGGGLIDGLLMEPSVTQRNGKSSIQSRPEKEVSSTGHKKVMWSLNTKRIGRSIGIAHTVLANYYKGLGSGQILTNGVIEYYEQNG